MTLDKRTIDGLELFLKEHLEADVTTLIAESLDVSAEKAMKLYYESKVADAVAKGSLGMQYLPASYLADEVLKGLPSAQTAS